MPRLSLPAARRAATTHYRYGDRGPAARAAHAVQSTRWRREVAGAELPTGVRRRLVRTLMDLPDITAAAASLGLSASQVYGRMRWDQALRDEVEATLAAHCRAIASGRCGSPSGYRRHGGRCRQCRAAHHGRDGR